MNKALCVFLFFLFCFTSCSRKGEIIAKIGRNDISTAMFEKRLEDMTPAYQSYLKTDSGKKQFLDLLIRERLVLEAAKSKGVDKKPEYAKSLNDFISDQKKRLNDYKENLMMQLYIRDLHDTKIGVTNKEIEDYYEKNKSELLNPKEIQARHILLSTMEDAQKALKRLRAGEDFGKIAREVSVDPTSAANGGQIGPIKKGELVPEFENAVFPLKTGRLSDIIKTQFGFHIIQKMSEKQLPSATIEELKLEVRRFLEKSKFDAWLEAAKKEYNVITNYDVLSKIKLPDTNPDAISSKTQGQ